MFHMERMAWAEAWEQKVAVYVRKNIEAGVKDEEGEKILIGKP